MPTSSTEGKLKSPAMASNNLKHPTRTLSAFQCKQQKLKLNALSNRYSYARTRGIQYQGSVQDSIRRIYDKILRLPFSHGFSAEIISIHGSDYRTEFILRTCNMILKRQSFRYRHRKDLHTLKYRQRVLSSILAYGIKTRREFPIRLSRKDYDIAQKALGDLNGLEDALVDTEISHGKAPRSHC
jgi:hypothetical protein